MKPHLHDCNSTKRYARPVEGPDADAAGYDGTQTLDQLVGGLQDGDEPAGSRKLDNIRCATLGTLNLEERKIQNFQSWQKMTEV